MLQRRETIANGSNQARQVPPIHVMARDRALPVSFAQERLWFLDQLEPGNPAYNLPAAVRLSGALDLVILEQSLNEILRRHEALRTTFTLVEGQPVQIITPLASCRLAVMHLEGVPKAEQEAEVQRLASEAVQRPFDLAHGPLWRAQLLRLTPEEHVLLLTMHHTVCDARSVEVLCRELLVLYDAFSAGQPSPLPELPVQYADFAHWQQQYMRGEVFETQLVYWQRQLADAPLVLELPTDYPRPAIQTYRGARQSLVLTKSLSEALKELSQQHGTTLFMTLLAALQTLLYRYTGQQDILVGTPVSYRPHAEVEGLLGPFTNTLVLRSNFTGMRSFPELLAQVRDVTLGAFAHQDLPFEKLVEALHPERNLSRTPLFQVCFALQHPRQALQSPGLTMSLLEKPTGTSRFDLDISLMDTAQGLRGALEYNAAMFEADSIQQLLEHFQHLLESLVADPTQQLSALLLSPDTTPHHLASRWQHIRPDTPFTAFTKTEIEQSIPERFAMQVKCYPQHVAVKTTHYEWTYATLHRKATQIAHTLWAICETREERIALLFDHDAPMIAAIFGVLQAGKIYVPLDPFTPKERLVSILEDAQARTIVIDNQTQALAQKLTDPTRRLLNIDALDSTAAVEDLCLPVSPTTLAYLLYTSGSTGQPKGVMQNHRNVLHHIRTYTNNLHIHAKDRLTLFSSYGFDAAVMDIFGALLNGATLYPINIREAGLADVSQWLLRHEITIFHATPTVYRAFMSTLQGQEAFPKLRLVVLGGEEVYKTDVDLYKQHFSPACLLVNGLGPTESTVSLQYFINKQTEVRRQAIPVGYPVEDTEVFLLNETGEQAVGYGEIALRSPHLALGYWRQPQRTAAAFLPDPEGGERCIYRTGDLGRRLPDGSLAFVGRKDFQVKIRGFRIELGEIEAVLGYHPAVQQTVVVAREDAPGDKRLVAYIIPAQEPGPTSSELRHFLEQKLPAYMIPAAFVSLQAFPLTPNGKVDRRALPKPDVLRAEIGDVVPHTPMQTLLAKIWREVLGVDQVSVYDNFFDLGGHSLLSLKVIFQMEKRTGQRLSPREMVFQTLGQLAAVYEQRMLSKPALPSKRFIDKLAQLIKTWVFRFAGRLVS